MSKSKLSQFTLYYEGESIRTIKRAIKERTNEG